MKIDVQQFIRAVSARKEIGIKEVNGWRCYAYNVAFPDTFDDPLIREARGIIIDGDGCVLRRPFEKFFNVNEREETQIHLLAEKEIDYIMGKS